VFWHKGMRKRYFVLIKGWIWRNCFISFLTAWSTEQNYVFTCWNSFICLRMLTIDVHLFNIYSALKFISFQLPVFWHCFCFHRMQHLTYDEQKKDIFAKSNNNHSNN
jgi:hypothetical protein